MSSLDVIGVVDKLDRHHCASKSAEQADVVSAPAVVANGVSVNYGSTQAIKNVSLTIGRNKITSLIGPSGCGKSTFLRCLNRMNDRIPGFSLKGEVSVDGSSIYAAKVDLLQLRRKIGMVFQKPNPFLMNIFENIALAPRIHYGIGKSDLDDVVVGALQRAALWDEVKDCFKSKSAMALSGGQQQRLCIARTLAVQPEIILMDEPCSALDPISTFKIEELIVELAAKCTIIVVTHNMQQASRISHQTGFFMLGEMIEFGETLQIFANPHNSQTEAYVTGRFG